jgi:hypothetical protein
MRIFKRKKVGTLSQGQEMAAQRIADGLISRQRRLADYLNARMHGISARSWLWLLVGFCLVFGGYCLYLVVAAIG